MASAFSGFRLSGGSALMVPIQAFSTGVLGEIIRRQPPSAARTAFAWRLVVGSTLGRVTSVQMDGTTLQVMADDARWLDEIDRARAAILPRLQTLLGSSTVTKIRTR